MAVRYQLDNLDYEETEPLLKDYEDEIIELFAYSTDKLIFPLPFANWRLTVVV